jgi:hypothetical protein
MSALIENQQNSGRFNEESEKFKLFQECHNLAFRSWAPFLQEAGKDLQFYLGDQWAGQDKAHLKEQGRNALVFNRIRRNIKMVAGKERDSRHSWIAQPTENSDQETASILTAALLWASQADEMANTMSDAFEGALKTGINLLELSIDHHDDPIYGDIRLSRVPYNAFLLDPRFTKRDLSDCEFVLQRRLLSKDAVKALLPFRADDIENISGKGADGKFSGMQQFASGSAKQTMKYDQFWLRKFRDAKVLIDRDTGEMREFSSKELDGDKMRFFLARFPQLAIINKQIPTVELNVFVENQLMFSGDDPWGIGDRPYTPVMAFWDPEYTANHSQYSGGTPGTDDYRSFFADNHVGDFSLKLQSLVRCSRDPQSEANKRRSKMLDIIDSQLNTGWQAKEGSVVNPKDMYQSGQGKVVWMKDEAQMSDALKINPPDIPAGLFNLSQMMDQDIVEIAGITDELLGMQDDGNLQMSGVLAKLRQGAGLTVLQDLFDNYRLSQKLVGKKMIRMIQSNWGPEKVRRVTNEEPTEEFYSKQFGKYDVSVEESMETPSQRALAYAQLLQAKQLGLAIPDELIIEFMPLTDKKGLKEAMARQAESAARIEEERLEDQARMRELQRAKVFNDIGLGVERLARAEADRGLAAERESEFAENHAQAALARAKAMKEIESMETDNLIKLVSFIREQEAADRQISQQVNMQRRAETENEFGNLVSALQLPGQPGLLATSDRRPSQL